MPNQVFRYVALGALAVAGLGGVFACSESSPQAEPVAAEITNGLAPSNGRMHKVGQFTAHVDHAKGQFIIEPLGTPIVLGDDLEPLSGQQLTQNQFVQDDGGGTPTVNTVDLVTTSYTDKPNQHTFTADVELRSFYTRSFAYVYVQIAAVTLDGGAISGYDGTNSVTSNPLGLDPTHGLWSYSTNSPSDAGLFIAANPNTKTTAGRWTDNETWIFANASDQNIVYTIDVWASPNFTSYTQGFGTASYVDVCGTSGAGSTTTAKANGIALPFDFTAYNTNTSTVSMGNNGILAFAATTSNSGNNVFLPPDASVPGPAFFPFWDNLATADGGMMCWATVGSQPNLVEAFEWKNMEIAGGAGAGSTLDFEVLLHEGTGVIDTVYNAMTAVDGGAARAAGSKATVGILNEDDTKATAVYNNAEFGTGKAYTYIPAP